MLSVRNGVIIDEDKDLYEISTPAVMFDKDTGTIHKYGNKEFVQSEYNRWVAKGALGITQSLRVFEFDTNTMSTNEICDVMERMISCTGYILLYFKRQGIVIE